LVGDRIFGTDVDPVHQLSTPSSGASVAELDGYRHDTDTGDP
jgi:hypothetical protein